MTIIKHGTLVNAESVRAADIALDNGKIARIAPDITPDASDEVIDATGKYVFPGFIDAHTHFDMNTGTAQTADDFASGTAAAVIGGTTTIVDFATQDKGMSLTRALRLWHDKADGKSSCNYGFHMAITDWNESVRHELPDMVNAGVTTFKLYMAYDALRLGDAQIYDVLRELRKLGGLVGVHCENGDLVNARVAELRTGGRLSPSAHPVSRPDSVEAEAVNRLLYISVLADCPVNIVHLSTARGLAEVRAARKRGLRVFVETCPQYLLLDDSAYSLPNFEGAKFVCSPPLRKADDRAALLQAALDGEIDTLATDHCSFNFKGQKELGLHDFSRIPNGLPGVEHRPKLIYTALVSSGLMPVTRMCALLSANPAKVFGMYPRKGVLMEGADADIVVWDGDRPGVISAATQLQNVDYTPYEGRHIAGAPCHVFVNGEPAVRDYALVTRRLGRYVARDVPLAPKP